MSKLLINEYPLQVLPQLAVKIGLNKAIMLQQIHYWTADPRCPNEREGRKWHYDTYEGWQKQFPFWSIMTIRRTAEALRKDKLVVAKALNSLQGDRTLWYAVDYDELAKLELGGGHMFKMNTPSVQDEQTHKNKMNNCIYKEQRLRSETSTENNNREIAEVPSAVVVDELFENGNRMIPKPTLRKFLTQHTKEQINEKLSLFRHAEGIKSPAAWLRKALQENWAPKAEEPKSKEGKKVEDPEIVANRYRRAQESAIKHLDRIGIYDPRTSGEKYGYDAVRAYDTRLTNEIENILHSKLGVTNVNS